MKLSGPRPARLRPISSRQVCSASAGRRGWQLPALSPGETAADMGGGRQAPVEIFARLQVSEPRSSTRSTRQHPTFDGRAGWIARRTDRSGARADGGELDGARLDAELSFPAQIKRVFAAGRGGDDDQRSPGPVLQGTSPAELSPRSISIASRAAGAAGAFCAVRRSRLPRRSTMRLRDVAGVEAAVSLDRHLAVWCGHLRVDRGAAECPIDAAKLPGRRGLATLKAQLSDFRFNQS